MSAGRPTKFKSEFVEQARMLCAKGFTDDELAQFFGVNRATIYRWKADNDAFCDAIKSGGSPADDRVERSLYERAVGYSFDAVKIMQYQGSEVVVPYREHVPPDTGAAIFWLKNRRKDQWRDKTETGFTDPNGDPLLPSVTVTVTRAPAKSDSTK